MPLWGDGSRGCLATQGGASRLRRDALPWAILSLPLRGVRTIGSRRPCTERTAQAPKKRPYPKGPPCPKQTGYAPAKPPSVEKTRCPEGAKHVSPGQSEAAQPPSAALGKRRPPTSVALKGRNKCAANAPQTRETVRRNDSNAGITRNMADSFAFVSLVEARESSPSNYIRFAKCS